MCRSMFLGPLLALAMVLCQPVIEAQMQHSPATNQLPRIQVHADGHSLETDDGRPFFWMGDTAWELIHHTTREEASYYLHTRGRQGFTVIQTVVLSEFDGINQPSVLGLKPLIDNDPRRPNPAYFDRIVEIVDEAAANGLYVALVPIWGDKLTAPWGTGPRLFRSDRADVADGEQRRDFIWVGDVVDVMLWLLDSPETSGIFNVGTGQARSYRDLARAVCAAAGVPDRVEFIDMPAALRGHYQSFTEAPMRRLRAAGYLAPFTPLEEGVRRYVQEFLAGPNPYL